MTSLIIVESPAKCKKIEEFLGSGYKCMASYGHIRSLKGLNNIDITNNYAPTFTPIEDTIKQKQLQRIQTAIASATEVILATDDDREGEAIAWHICQHFGLDIARTKRIIFHEITETALRSAIAHPKRINMDIVNAQQGRQILDMLVGFKVSPVLWKYISRKHDSSLSAGRCQTPALRIVYDNYLDIKNNAGKLVYGVTGYFTSGNLLFELNKKLETKDEVLDFLGECKDKGTFTIKIEEPKKSQRKSPEPLTTSALQQMASNELHLSPKDTMKCAQQLYEGGFITYMRTDSKKYSAEFVALMREFIVTSYGDGRYISETIDGLISGVKLPSKKTKKGAPPPPQEAHEAIRPVDLNVRTITPSDDEMSPKAIRLYDLIWKRTVESCMSNAEFNVSVASIDAPLETTFKYKAEQITFAGWLAVEGKYEKQSKDYILLSNMRNNTTTPLKKIECKFGLVDMKTHYTEAKLVQILEELGIGRPSTFAMLVDKIQERGYVEKKNLDGRQITEEDFSIEANEPQIISEDVTRTFGNEKGKLVIQPLGIIVMEFLANHFDALFNYEYTKQMEDQLDLIAKGELVWHNLCASCDNQLTTLTGALTEEDMFKVEIDAENTLIIGKHGPVIRHIDQNDETNVSFIPVKKDINIANLEGCTVDDIKDEIKPNTSLGKYEGENLYVKKGKYGIYAIWGGTRRSLAKEFGNRPVENITYQEVLDILDKESPLKDPTKPVGLVREISPYISIRTGKYGDYIYYKTTRMTKPKFLKLAGFVGDYKTCPISVFKEWLKTTHGI